MRLHKTQSNNRILDICYTTFFQMYFSNFLQIYVKNYVRKIKTDKIVNLF